ncbi:MULTISPECIES: GDSL-type esterase/lipase family protein [unclassified Butyrivibrio]|uniref:GDSL-type esterase/lipase family protein n=1 Tax=unclassified Butyrivibrio TaxID=2639466 RepID=UPI0004288A61|nr:MULTISPECIES: GDSL-type esterase/lipase family protein [unclassified Butyrivibrio]
MANLLAFGDSNTWGLIPGTKERYPWGIRWTSLVQEKLSEVRIIEDGLCGRTTVFDDHLRPFRKGTEILPLSLESNYPLDAAIIMLGTNDCKKVFNANPHIIGKGLELCLDELEKYVAPEKILVVSPIKLGDEVYLPEKDPEFDENSVKTSINLKREYERIAKRRGNQFLAASDFASPSSIDDEHMDESGHRSLSAAILDKLEEMKIA